MLHESVASREEWCRRGAALLLPDSHFPLGIPVYMAIIGRRQALDPRCREGGADEGLRTGGYANRETALMFPKSCLVSRV